MWLTPKKEPLQPLAIPVSRHPREKPHVPPINIDNAKSGGPAPAPTKPSLNRNWKPSSSAPSSEFTPRLLTPTIR
ncbi:hypothetical protein TNCV_2065851 [Trichonephila clavipes]|nr:hypothetical protein TNCV_2065851 [Trichonephila clavipes]